MCFNTIISAALKTRDIDSLVIALREMEQQVSPLPSPPNLNPKPFPPNPLPLSVDVRVQGVEPDKYTRQAMESAGAAAAMLKIGGILGTFSSRFKSRLAEVVICYLRGLKQIAQLFSCLSLSLVDQDQKKS